MNFDKWARDLADQLREKEQVGEIKPEDLYTHKDIMRGEGMFSPDYNPANVKVTFDGEEIDPVKDQHKGMDPPFGFNVGGNWFRDQQAYEEFLKLEEYTKLQEQARLLREELDKAPLYMFGHNCTSTETVWSISSAPDIDYNEVLPKNGKVCCTKDTLGETLLLIWAATGDQYVITDAAGELVELTEVNKNG